MGARERATSLELEKREAVGILQDAARDVSKLKNALDVERRKVEDQANARAEMASEFEVRLQEYQEKSQAEVAKLEIAVERERRRAETARTVSDERQLFEE